MRGQLFCATSRKARVTCCTTVMSGTTTIAVWTRPPRPRQFPLRIPKIASSTAASKLNTVATISSGDVESPRLPRQRPWASVRPLSFSLCEELRHDPISHADHVEYERRPAHAHALEAPRDRANHAPTAPRPSVTTTVAGLRQRPVDQSVASPDKASLERPKGVEPLTLAFEARCSVR